MMNERMFIDNFPCHLFVLQIFICIFYLLHCKEAILQSFALHMFSNTYDLTLREVWESIHHAPIAFQRSQPFILINKYHMIDLQRN